MILVDGRKGRVVTCMLGIMLITLSGCTSTEWRAKLSSELPVLGHRNWIVIADSAYPKQSASGIETINTNAGQIEVLEKVLADIEAAPHVQAIVLLDEEMDAVTEEAAPGIEDYRKRLKELLKGQQVEAIPHEEIIRKLDTDAKIFNILLLKTDMVIPYTSVFLKLDCGYWNAEKEKRLRDSLKRDK